MFHAKSRSREGMRPNRLSFSSRLRDSATSREILGRYSHCSITLRSSKSTGRHARGSVKKRGRNDLGRALVVRLRRTNQWHVLFRSSALNRVNVLPSTSAKWRRQRVQPRLGRIGARHEDDRAFRTAQDAAESAIGGVHDRFHSKIGGQQVREQHPVRRSHDRAFDSFFLTGVRRISQIERQRTLHDTSG